MSDFHSRIDSLSPEKRALLERHLLKRTRPAAERPIPRREAGVPAPLSFAQQRLWFLDQWAPGAPTYNAALALEIHGSLRADCLEGAFRTIITRHEILRTVYKLADGQPVQVALENPPFQLRRFSLAKTPAGERQAAVEKLMAQEGQRSFDLSRDALIAAALIEMDERRHILFIVAHHIACDGWSRGILYDELSHFYGAFTAGREPSLPELPIQYADFAAWQRQWLQGAALESLLAYWTQQLAGAPPSLPLPTDKPRPVRQAFAGAHLFFDLDPELAARVKEFTGRDATLFMTCLAAFKTLLHCYTGSVDILAGSPVANRNRVELEGLIGFFVNTLALRTDLSGDPSFRTLVARVKEAALGAYAHQDLPFEKVVEALRAPRDLSRNPVFQVNFRVQTAPAPEVRLGDLEVRHLDVDIRTSKFDLALELRATHKGMDGFFEYNTALFEPETVVRMADEFRGLLSELVSRPDSPLSKLAAVQRIRAAVQARKPSLRSAARRGVNLAPVNVGGD